MKNGMDMKKFGLGLMILGAGATYASAAVVYWNAEAALVTALMGCLVFLVGANLQD